MTIYSHTYPQLDFRAPPRAPVIEQPPAPAPEKLRRLSFEEMKARQAGRLLQWREQHSDKPLPNRFRVTDLNRSVCHFPLNDGPDFLFCGEAVARRNYCAHHATIAYQSPR